MYNNEILKSIDSINDAVHDSEMAVLESIIDSYDKATMILENYEGDNLDSFEIFSESFIMEANNGTMHKRKNIIKCIIDVITKLINRIRNFFKNKFNKKSNNKISNNNNNNYIDDDFNLFKICDYAMNNRDFNKWVSSFSCPDGFKEIYPIKEHKYDYYKNYTDKIFEYMTKIEKLLKDVNAIADKTDNTTPDGAKTLTGIYNYIGYFKSIIYKFDDILKYIDSSNNDVDDILSKYKLSENSFKYVPSDNDGMPDDIKNKLFNLALILRTTNDYAKYKKAYNELFDMINFPKNHIISAGSLDKHRIKQRDYFYIHILPDKESDESTSVSNDIKLYHTSKNKINGFLKPTFRSVGDADAMYPSPRVYFFINNPGSRITTSNKFKYKPLDGEHVYEYNGKFPITVKFDTEAQYSAYRKSVYIETDKPVSVKEVTNQFK